MKIGGAKRDCPRHLRSLTTNDQRLPYCSSVPFPFGSSGGITTAAATRSPGSTFSKRTPWAERPDSRMNFDSMRMILPYWHQHHLGFLTHLRNADNFAVARRGLDVD